MALHTSLCVLALTLPSGAPIQESPATGECSAAGFEGQFDCLRVPVPENRAQPGGREIELHVVVLPALGSDPAPDPVFLIMGGPGQSAADKAQYFASVMHQVRQSRDLVLVDARGTGESNPLDFEIGADDLVAQIDETLPLPIVERELARLESRADFTQYTTDNAMDDLDDVRIALGYETINLYGASYGTRAALVYMRRHGEHVRSVVLKAVAPLGFTVGQYFARDAQRSLEGVFAACTADPNCKRAFGDVGQRFEEWMAALEAEPVPVETENPLDGSKLTVLVSARNVALTIRTMLYSTPGMGALPRMIARGAEGDLEQWAAMILDTRLQQLSWIYEGAALAVLAAEDLPIADADVIEATARGTFLGEEFANDFLDAAAAWPHAKLDESFWKPVRSEVPALLLSGALDPVTPPAFADEASRHLPNSLHVTFPHGSHGDTAFRPCMDGLLEAFYRTGTVAGLDASCVASSPGLRFRTR